MQCVVVEQVVSSAWFAGYRIASPFKSETDQSDITLALGARARARAMVTSSCDLFGTSVSKQVTSPSLATQLHNVHVQISQLSTREHQVIW